MALSAIPLAITAGAAVSVQLSLPNFPASQGWSLRWVVRGQDVVRLVINATVQGDDFLLNLSGADSAKLLGLCSWQLWVAKDQDTRLVRSGVTRVTAGLETVTQEEKILVSLRTALERLAQDDEAEVWIHERKLVFKDPKKIQEMIEIYESKVRIQRGGSPIVTIPVVLR